MMENNTTEQDYKPSSLQMSIFDKCKLVVSNLPKSYKKQELIDLIAKVVPQKFYLFQRDIFTNEMQRYMFLEMKTPADSYKLIRELNFQMFKESEIQVNYIKYDQYYCQATKVFLKKLPPTCSAKKIYEAIKECDSILSVVVNRSIEGKPLGYGSIQFYNHQDLEKALRILNGLEVDGEKISANVYEPPKTAAVNQYSLYLKNFPGSYSKVEIEQWITSLPELQNHILSFKVNSSQFKGKESFSVFLNLDSQEIGQQFVQGYANKPLDENQPDLKLYISEVEKKESRVQKQAVNLNETIVYLNHLKDSIKEEEILSSLSAMGKINGLNIRKKYTEEQLTSDKSLVQNISCLVYFADQDSAFDCIVEPKERFSNLFNKDFLISKETLISLFRSDEIQSNFQRISKVINKTLEKPQLLEIEVYTPEEIQSDMWGQQEDTPQDNIISSQLIFNPDQLEGVYKMTSQQSIQDFQQLEEDQQIVTLQNFIIRQIQSRSELDTQQCEKVFQLLLENNRVSFEELIQWYANGIVDIFLIDDCIDKIRNPQQNYQ